MQNKPRKSNENAFMTLLNFLADPAVIVDEKGRFLIVNDAFVDLTGLSKEKVVGTAFLNLSLLTAESKAILLKNLMKRMQSLSVEPYEIGFTDKTGKARFAEAKAKKIDYAGRPADLVIFRDITRRKENARRIKEYSEKMEALVNEKVKEVKESEERYRALTESISDIFFAMDKNLKYTYWNKASERLTGISAKDAIGKALTEIFPNVKGTKVEQFYKEVLRTKQPQSFVNKYRFRDKDFVFEINAYPTMAGLSVFVKDITEHKRLEDALKQERDMLEAITENVGAGLAIISKDYHILWANKLLKQINGDCEGKMCYSTFNRLTGICPDCGVQKVFDNGVLIDVHEYVTKDDKGNTVWVELVVTPIKDEKGNVIAALELAVNITERKIMQNKLAEYSQKLEKLVAQRTEQLKQTQAKLVKSERLATIGELAAMIGHDLRNPLTGIMSAAYYLKAKHGTEISAKGKEMLETIENAINHSNKIINDLLEYSRDLKLEFTETTPKAMLQSALSLLEIPEKIQIIDTTENEPMVKVDTEKIRNVFVRIIRNAIDAMPEGGTLTVKSRKVKDKLEIAFTDTGIGLSEETLSKLKGGAPLFTTKAQGMGFGLPICRRLAEAHGGKIHVKSAVGKGTTVTVTLPVKPEPVAEGEEKWIFSETMLSAITAAQRAP